MTNVEGVRYLAAEGPFVEVFGPVEKGNWYFKKGRTTGIVGGICHGTEVHPKRQNQSRQSCKPTAHTSTNTSSKPGQLSSSTLKVQEPNAQQRTFATGGYNGALVFDHDGICCRLLVGSYSSDTGPHAVEESGKATAGAGLVVPIKDVRGWIGQAVRSGQPDGTPMDLRASC
ncbi:MAG: hypothetical protein LQ346_007829 [Caloplaca aetnensis]|nr:MAG: hypothetical protein LQ346_007829 [Caloplaca aetnensis]